MRYFTRLFIVFVLVFSLLFIGIQQFLLHEPSNETNLESMIFNVAPTMKSIPPRETEAGLLLSGIAAQNRRDWGNAWKNFSRLNEKYLDNPDFALRAFTLALGNGDFKQASAIAKPLEDSLFAKDIVPNDALAANQFDLMRILLILQNIKNSDFSTAQQNLATMKTGPLTAFSKPIIDAWLAAEINPTSITDDVTGLSPLQIYYKALAADYGHQTQTAITLMDHVEQDVFNAEKTTYIAAFYVRANHKQKAINFVRSNLLKFPDQEDLGILLAELKGKTDPAFFDDYQRHLGGIIPALGMAYHDFSAILLNEMAVDSALLFSRMAAYLDPETPSVYVTIAEILKYQQQDAAALEAFAMIKPTDPAFEQTVTEQIAILESNNRIDEAYTIIQNAMTNSATAKLPENPYFYYLEGNILKAKKDYSAALVAYNKAEQIAIAQSDNDDIPQKLWPIYYSRGVNYDLMNEWDKAEADMKIALEKYPRNPVILNYLGYGYADRDINLDLALDMLSQAVIGAPNDPYIIDSMGWILYRTGDYEQAIQFLERAASLSPYHMVINDHLGDAYWKVGRKLEAYYMWQRAIDYYDPTSEEQQRMIEDTRKKANGALSKNLESAITDH